MVCVADTERKVSGIPRTSAVDTGHTAESAGYNGPSGVDV